MLLLSPYLVASQALATSRVPIPGAVPFNNGTRFIPLRIVVAQLVSLLPTMKVGESHSLLTVEPSNGRCLYTYLQS